MKIQMYYSRSGFSFAVELLFKIRKKIMTNYFVRIL